jgi:hypothetical protein
MAGDLDSPEKILPYKVSGSRLTVRIQLPPPASLVIALLSIEPPEIGAFLRLRIRASARARPGSASLLLGRVCTYSIRQLEGSSAGVKRHRAFL